MRNLISKLKSLFSLDGSIKVLSKEITNFQLQLNNLKYDLGKVHAKLNWNLEGQILENIAKAEFQVFSQWGDDGIIQFLINYLDIKDRKFVEFGVENYKECNTRFLLINNNWIGLVMDGSDQNIIEIQNEPLYWKYNLTAKAEFITAENINKLLLDYDFKGDIGLLHIDIDGNDYWVWKAIQVIYPLIVVVEYNSVFGPNKPWTIPYNHDFIRTKYHYSNLYYGSSILSLIDLAKEKGYVFIGCNSNGNNAYFVREDKKKLLKEKSASEGFVLSQFSESRDQSGQLTYIRSDKRLELIRGLPVYNTRDNIVEKIL
jgi:hypothetical protein